VHGSGGGGWNWDRVAPLLREAGHEVRTPDLEMRDADIGVDDHAAQVIDAIGELTDVVLVGHSYGGMPIAVVADRIPERLARVVYLDAFAPSDGDSGVSQRPDLVDWIVPLARNGLLPPIPPEQVGADEADYELLRSGLTTTPLRCWTDPVRLTGAGERVPRTYIWCLRSGYGKIARRLREDPTWDVRELDTTHMATYTVPNELAALLLELA
jgi:pimeloyl-ACP methyl ester carboxylesterase